jgi:signal transduction histidine kinase
MLVIAAAHLSMAQDKGPAGVFDLEITVDGKQTGHLEQGLRIPASARDIGVSIKYVPTKGGGRPPDSFHFKWEGVDPDWRRLYADMGFVARFLGASGDAVKHDFFSVFGDSPGWKGNLNDSKVVRRRESITVPPGARRLTLLVSSAGGPATIGTYAAENITVLRRSPDGLLTQVFPLAPFSPLRVSPDGSTPVGWVRDGVHASMATLARLDSPEHSAFALGLVDDDADAHAEWRLDPAAEIPVQPGETLVLQWEEMYSIGTVGEIAENYPCPPPGNYRFLVKCVSPSGATVAGQTVDVVVFRPYWMQPWFWAVVGAIALVLIGLGVRMVIRARIRAYLRRVDQEHAIERERLRIARDLHDDLGARLTHISFFSQRSVGTGVSLEESQEKLRSISDMTRSLVSSLYETVWSVDPENDNLDALISYLTQMVDNLCEPIAIRYRIKAPDVIPHLAVGSDIRHNVSLTVKEAVHNAIKHSGASELTVTFEVALPLLTVVIADNGRGFDASQRGTGNGLKNMQQRLNIVKGTVKLESTVGSGTVVKLEIPLR